MIPNLCIAFTLLNPSLSPLTLKDIQTLARASKTCERRYKGCLKTFTKTGTRSYKALCSDWRKK